MVWNQRGFSDYHDPSMETELSKRCSRVWSFASETVSNISMKQAKVVRLNGLFGKSIDKYDQTGGSVMK